MSDREIKKSCAWMGLFSSGALQLFKHIPTRVTWQRAGAMQWKAALRLN